MGGCSVRGCKNNKPYAKGVILCKIPGVRNDVRRQAWVTALRNSTSTFNLSTSRVCEVHFLPHDWEKVREDGSRKLRTTAVPSLYMGNSNGTPLHSTPLQVRKPFQDITNTPPSLPSLPPDSHQVPDHTYSTPARKVSSASVLSSLAPSDSSEIPSDPISVPSAPPSDSHRSISSPLKAIDAVDDLHYKTLLSRYDELLQENQMLRSKSESNNELVARVSALNAQVSCLRKNAAKGRKEKHQLRQQAELTKENLSQAMSPDQLNTLSRRSTQGLKRTTGGIAEGLYYKSQFGTTAYDDMAKRFRLPASRTLCSRTQHLKYSSGVLTEVFQQLEGVVSKLSDPEKDCHLCFDEMAIDPNDKLYDPSTKSPIGSCTLPGHAGPASKVLCFMLAGVSSRWKVAVAYFYSGNRIKGESMNKTAEGLLQIIKDIITRSHTVGLRVASISSDMGADNRALWRLLGIVGKRSGKVNTTTPHPCDSNRLLHVLPDVPHVFKNIVHMLHSNEIIILPDDIVKENQLPSNIVCWNHIKYLMEHEVKYELKIAYKLLIEKLTSGHFEKMQVGRAKSIFNNQTAAGLIILSDKLKTPAYKTTAWFISVVVRWFELTASRSHGVVLSLAKREEYAEAISHIELTRSVFQRTRVGSKGEWKPAQEGVIIASTSIINLQDYYLNERDYAFLLTSRFNQDCLENLFSQIRRRNKTPNALLFKNILRMILLSGKCFRPPRGHGYEYDEGEMLLGLLLESGAAEPNDSQDSNDIGDYQNVHCPEITDDCIFSIIEDWELLVLYYMAGAALRKCMETFKILRSCDCVQVLSWQGSSHHTFAAVVLERNYKEGALLEVSDECFRAIVKCEINFRILRGSLLKEKNVDVVKELCKKSTYVWKSIACPLCHSDITEKLMVKYFVMRLKQYGQRGKRDVAHILSKFSSRSIAQKEFAKNLNVSHN